ncbi:C40 family peptidase [Rhodohalobacter sp. 614A]|uniref:C40 family peptidase n=1 Tax=Rhodohalobacter sp. 614A TaxID=2908649 RepID=UPI001F28D862|nr:TIGR02594 family protein [Rhodohalobacter sp. 614A]
MDKIIQVATKELGISEISGSQHNKRILQYSNEIGISWIDDDETPWCSVFMNWVAMKCGVKRSGSAAARSWLTVGLPVENPEPGDIVVYWRGDPNSHQGHVGIFFGYSSDKSRVYTLGGNQNNSVSISAYPAERVLSFRRLQPDNKFELKDKDLKKGDTGTDVVNLQNALKLLQFNAGTSDGIFGPKTEGALKQFQATNFELEISGIFDAPTREHMLELLNA